jgi:hypothetical protein
MLAENYKIFPRHPNESNKFKFYCSTLSNAQVRASIFALCTMVACKNAQREVRSENTSIYISDAWVSQLREP